MNRDDHKKASEPLDDFVQSFISDLTPEKKEELRQLAWREGKNIEDYIAEIVEELLTPGTEENKEMDRLLNTFFGQIEVHLLNIWVWAKKFLRKIKR